jgi:asparagine synthase (glutamine-hydrolysing)
VCGIAGVAGAPVDIALLQRMAAAIQHRGPDAQGSLLREEMGFAFRRLSIIDVAGGNQPIFNEDKSAAIMLNGEIYNHHELRASLVKRGHRFRTRSDVETVLHLWEDKGEDCLQELRGMFAFAIWNDRDQSLFLARDRLGKKPLYYTHLAGGGIVFGSEIKAILQHPDVRREPNLDAVDQFLVLQYVPSPVTAFRGIDRIAPAHWLRWRDGRIELQRYWRLDFEDKLQESETELKEEMLRLLREAVSIRLESEVPLGAFLSGGIDSSTIVALAAGASSGPLRTFSIGFEPSDFDESPFARLVAQRFATDHHHLVISAASPEAVDEIVWHYDQPFGDSSAIPTFQVARITRPHVTVVLTGDGGDESFAGYDRYRLSGYGGYFRLPLAVRLGLQAFARPFSRNAGRSRRLLQGRLQDPFDAYFAALVHLHPSSKSPLYTESFLAALSSEAPAPMMHLRSRPHAALLDSMLDADINNYLPDDLLVKMDVATMAYSLEARSPFLDHKLIEFMARVPTELKLRRGQSKYLLKSAVRGLLPDQILERPKKGFGVPLGRWLRSDLKEVLLDTVISDRALARGYFNPSVVREMVRAQVAGSDQFQFILWDLLVLERWHQSFIDQVPIPRQPLSAGAGRSLPSGRPMEVISGTG